MATPGFTNKDGMLLRINSEGDTLFTKRYPNNPIWAVTKLDSEKYIIALDDNSIRMVDMNLNHVWQKSFKGELPYKLARTSDDQIVFIRKGYLSKLDLQGEIIWEIPFAGGRRLIVDGQDNILCLAENSDIYKFDVDGNLTERSADQEFRYCAN